MGIIMLIFLFLICLSLFVIACISAAAYQTWRESMAHEHTVVRLYYSEDTGSAPEIQTILEGCTYDQIIAIIGALDVAKNSVLSCVTYEDLSPEEAEDAQDLFNGDE